jgi:transposase
MRGNKTYSESLKREVVRELKLGNLSKKEARRKYEIKGHSALLKWIRKFDDKATDNQKLMDYKKSDKDALIKRIKELERQLEDEQIRAEGLPKMIDIAEEQLKITIRKKSTTKQSRRLKIAILMQVWGGYADCLV